MRRTLRARRAPPPRHSLRFAIAAGLVLGVYGVIGGRLLLWGALPEAGAAYAALGAVDARPDLVDRNGEVLATDIRSAALFAEPRRIADVDETTAALVSVLPDLDARMLHARLSGGGAFVWLKRQLTRRQQAEILALGLPGIGLRTEKHRFYPGGATLARVVGRVDGADRGIAGMEKYIDDQGLSAVAPARAAKGEAPAPVRLSLDLRIQHVVRDEIAAAMRRDEAAAAGGVILDAETGEVLAMASLPDRDPAPSAGAPKAGALDRMAAGPVEMGPAYRTFTAALALAAEPARIAGGLDASRPISVGGTSLPGVHARPGGPPGPDIFDAASRGGAEEAADRVAAEVRKAFLERLGLRAEGARAMPPSQPRVWRRLEAVSVSLAHGASTTPLQAAAAAAALLNGGRMIPPTFLPRTEAAAAALAETVTEPGARGTIGDLFGPAGEASSRPGAGPAAKRRDASLAAFPADRPRYVVLVVLDEPKVETGRRGTSASPAVGAIVRRSAGLLKVRPEHRGDGVPRLVSY